MACRLLRVAGIIAKSSHTGYILNNGAQSLLPKTNDILKVHTPLTQYVRSTTFFSKLPAEHLWKGVTSVSNAGKRRGRGKTRRAIKNLNRGQVIGLGRIAIQWPGLNTPIIRGREVVRQRKLNDDPNFEEKMLKIREASTGFKRAKVSPLERGWTGGKLGGKRIGPPDPIGEDTFEGFESWILECKTVSTMTSNLGRKRRVSSMVVTGNGNGLAGFGLGKKPDTKPSLVTAKNRAARKLMYIPRYNEHTVLHDFFTQFGKTKIYVTKVYEGYGLKCHRVINACCQAIGIKDLHAKIEGSVNTQSIVKAFFLGLLKQKSFQELADEKKLHLVEMNKDNDYFPVVLASPAEVREAKDIPSSEILDFKQHVLDGRIIMQRKKYPPFYTKHKSWEIRMRKLEYHRGQDDVRIRSLAEHGELRSFLTDKYPEARPQLWNKNARKTE